MALEIKRLKIPTLKPTDYAVRSNFALEMLQLQENDDFLDCILFSDESTFHLNANVNTHTVSESGDLKIPVNSYNPKETPQNLMCFVLLPDERFIDRSFSLKLT